MKQLVVTADDFGVSIPVNEAVERAHRDGILTSTSLMVSGTELKDAVERARQMPNLGVGLHVSLVNARPALPPERVPALVDRDGNFDTNLVRAGVRYFFTPRIRAQLEAEIRAQFDAFAATGLALDHVDAHNHMHVHPTLFRLILKVGREFDMQAMRIPAEPFRPSVAGVGNMLVIGPWAALMRGRLRSFGIRANDALFGLNDTGRMNESRVLDIIARLPDGLNELYVHPSACHPERRCPSTRFGRSGQAPQPESRDGTAAYARTEELDALLSPRVRDAIATCGIQLVRYGDTPVKPMETA